MREKEIFFSFVAAWSKHLHDARKTEAHNEARRDNAAFLNTFEFADTPIGLQSAGFRHMRFCERGYNYLTR